MAGTAVAIHYVAGGVDDVRTITRVRPWTVLGAGLTLAAVVALVPLALDGSVLAAGYRELDVPVLGAVKLSSVLAFDIGVYAVVFGLVTMLFEAFGDEALPADEADR